MKNTGTKCAIALVICFTVAAVWYCNQPNVIAARDKQYQDMATANLIEHNRKLKNTPGMEDCNFYQVDGYASVIRCPNSTVTTETGGKFNQRTVTNSN